jgi:hypothetical protein
MKSFDQLFRELCWKPIRNCPGRYLLPTAQGNLSLTDVLGAEHGVSGHRVAGARDVVWVARLEGGGLISYGRADASYLHTLNTDEGFARKLRELGIELSDE